MGMVAKWRGRRLHECVDAKPNSEKRTPSPTRLSHAVCALRSSSVQPACFLRCGAFAL